MSSRAASAGRMVAGRRAIGLPPFSTVVAARALGMLRTSDVAAPVSVAAVSVFSRPAVGPVCVPALTRFTAALSARAAALVGIDLSEARRAGAGPFAAVWGWVSDAGGSSRSVQLRHRIARISTTAATGRQEPRAARLPDAQTAAPLRRVLGLVMVR